MEKGNQVWMRAFMNPNSERSRDSVTPPEFFGLEVGASPDISLPIMMQPVVMPETESWLVERTMVSSLLRIFGPLKPGVDGRARPSTKENLKPFLWPHNPTPSPFCTPMT